MSSKFNRPPQTHRPLPWCKPPILPPPFVVPVVPRLLRAKLRLNRNSTGWPVSDLALYFPIVQAPTANHWAAEYITASLGVAINVQWDPASKILLATGGLIPPSGGTGFLEWRATNVTVNSEFHILLETRITANPIDQQGSLELWA